MDRIIKILKVSEKGQIALPKEVRELANINVGDSLVLIQKGDKILLEKAGFIESKTRDDFKDLLKLSELTAKKLWSNKYDEIWDKL